MFKVFTERIKKVASDISKESVEVFTAKKEKKEKVSDNPRMFSSTFNQNYSNGKKRDFSKIKQLTGEEMKSKVRSV